MQSSELQKFRTISGPAKLGDSIEKSPISCDFIDELENFSVRKVPVAVAYWTENSEPKVSDGLIVDIFTEKNKEEYLKLDSGVLVRLDKISEIHPLKQLSS